MPAQAGARCEWGYGREEGLSNADLIHEKYRGIRPAAGYPACPDHTEKGPLWRLLDVQANTGMQITESFAMWPGSSVSGLYFAHPESRYFSLGKIDRDQVADYSAAQRNERGRSRAMAGAKPELRSLEVTPRRETSWSTLEFFMNARGPATGTRLSAYTFVGTELSEVCNLDGGQGRNRTADASLFRAALYQLSYLATERETLGDGCCGSRIITINNGFRQTRRDLRGKADSLASGFL